MKTRFAVAVLSLALAAPALAQTPSPDTARFPQDAIVNGQHRQATRAEIEQRAATPGSPLAGQQLLDTSKAADKATDRLFEESLKNARGVTPDDPSARPPVGSR